MLTTASGNFDIGMEALRLCMALCESTGRKHAGYAAEATRAEDSELALSMALACFECSERMRQCAVQAYAEAGISLPDNLAQPRRLSDTKRHNKPLANPKLNS